MAVPTQVRAMFKGMLVPMLQNASAGDLREMRNFLVDEFNKIIDQKDPPTEVTDTPALTD